MGFKYAPEKVLSLLTTIRNVYRAYEQNIISGLSMIFHKVIRVCYFNPDVFRAGTASLLFTYAQASSPPTEVRLPLVGTGRKRIAWYRVLMCQRWFSNSKELRTH